MASPQKENGFVPIATELVEALARIRIPGEAMQVLWVILRQTYGWNKKAQEVSLAQFAEATGLVKPRICEALVKLQLMNIIVTEKRNDGRIVRIVKDYDFWQPLRKNVTLRKNVKSITEKRNEALRKNVMTQNSSIKDTRIDNKDNPPILPPAGGDTLFPENKPAGEQPKAPAENIPFGEILAYLNERTGRSFKPNSEATRRSIRARWAEGFRLEDFKRVVDNKCYPPRDGGWLGDPKMELFLRPGTLFGTKFEAYLNERGNCGTRTDGKISAAQYEREKWIRWEQREREREAAEDAEEEAAAGGNGGGNGHGDRSESVADGGKGNREIGGKIEGVGAAHGGDRENAAGEVRALRVHA